MFPAKSVEQGVSKILKSGAYGRVGSFLVGVCLTVALFPFPVHSHNDFLLAILTRCQILVSTPGKGAAGPAVPAGRASAVCAWIALWTAQGEMF